MNNLEIKRLHINKRLNIDWRIFHIIIICETQMVLKLQSLHFRTDQGLTFNTILKAMRLPAQSKEWLLLLPV